MGKFLVLDNLKYNKKVHPKGSEIELDEKSGAHLASLGLVSALESGKKPAPVVEPKVEHKVEEVKEEPKAALPKPLPKVEKKKAK